MPDGPGGERQSIAQRLRQVLSHDATRLAGSGLAVAGWWLWPLFHRQGVYGGGRYSLPGIAAGVIFAAAWLAALATALCPMRRRRAVGMRLGVALGAILIATIGCDVGYVAFLLAMSRIKHIPLSFSYQLNMPDDELIIRHRPLVSWRGRRSPDCDLVDFRTDEEGFRNPPGVHQADIVFLGDSVTEAGEVHEEATFVRQTERLLGRSALNLGVFSYGPQQELAVLNRFGLARQPRVVVWQVTEWNDLNDAQAYRAGAGGSERRMRLREVYERHSPLVALVARILPPKPAHVVAFVRSDGQVDLRSLWPYLNLVPSRPEGLQKLLMSIATASNVCRQRGIGFVVMFVPDQMRILAPYVRYANERERVHYESAEGLDPPNDLNHVLAQFCQALGCPFVDITEPLRKRAAEDNRFLYVRNDTHLGHDGHAIAAQALTRVLANEPALVASAPKSPPPPSTARALSPERTRR